MLAIGVFLLVYGLWYELPGNAWDYLAVTGNIYLASVFTLLVAALYWRRATTKGAYAALVLGAIGPITFLVVNLVVMKAQPTGRPSARGAVARAGWLLHFSQTFPNAKPIRPELAGASSFALAFLGMIVGSLLSRRQRAVTHRRQSHEHRVCRILDRDDLRLHRVVWLPHVLRRLQRRARDQDMTRAFDQRDEEEEKH